MTDPLDPLALKLRMWRDDPVLFVREALGVEKIDDWQIDALRAYGDPSKARSRLAMQACAGPGKTAVLAWIGWHFISCFFDPNQAPPKGAVVSETSNNLDMNLWPEMSRWRTPWLEASFEQTSEIIRSKDPRYHHSWCLHKASWPRAANPDEQGRTLSGVHGAFTLFLIDESGIIPPAVLRAAEQSLSEDPKIFGRIVQAGNPLSRKGMLYAASVTLREKWNVIPITGDPDDPKRATRVNIDEARDNIALFGRDNPWVKSYILGQFPDADFNALLSPEDVEAAFARAPRTNEFDFAPKILGVDIAFSGGDRTVILRRQGCIVYPPLVLRVNEPTDVALRVAQEWQAFGADACFIDNSGGFGTGVINALRQANFSPFPVQFAGKPNDPQYHNKRAEMWFLMRDWVKAGGALPKEPGGWMRELTEPLYTMAMTSGKTVMEDKMLVKKRLNGLSPDLADALALTFAQPVQPSRGPMVEDYRWNRGPSIAVMDAPGGPWGAG